jgi:hypothetical protein
MPREKKIWSIKIPFLHKSQKISFFRETLWADIECSDVYLELFSICFEILKYVFLDNGCMYTFEREWISSSLLRNVIQCLEAEMLVFT